MYYVGPRRPSEALQASADLLDDDARPSMAGRRRRQRRGGNEVAPHRAGAASDILAPPSDEACWGGRRLRRKPSTTTTTVISTTMTTRMLAQSDALMRERQQNGAHSPQAPLRGEVSGSCAGRTWLWPLEGEVRDGAGELFMEDSCRIDEQLLVLWGAGGARPHWHTPMGSLYK